MLTVTPAQLDKKTVENLLRFGAYDLFNEQADQASRKSVIAVQWVVICRV